jgi:phospholipase D1/2
MAEILSAGRNCWRVERAGRVAALVDVAAYFDTLRTVLLSAERQVFIVGWNLDGRIELSRPPRDDGAPNRLRELIAHIAGRRPDLTVYILLWDYTILYAAERQFLPSWDFNWATPANVRFILDDHLPIGGSHHQKIVVIDDAVAFVGGLDLTSARWDTPDHEADDPRRVDHAGNPEGAFHDVQLALDGAAARAVGDLCRERWKTATGETIEAPTSPAGAVWPDLLEADWRDVSVGIARTVAPFDGNPGHREILALYKDAIAAAQDSIYLENQYLAAGPIAEALERRLKEADGPEVIIVTQRECSSWIEDQVMGVRRAKILYRLDKADAHGRLRVLTPVIPGVADADFTLHAKVSVIDDRMVQVGSANLNNRSMGYDTECDIAIVCDSDDRCMGATAFRNGLIAEHLGCTPGEISKAIAETGSLGAAIDALNPQSGRRLERLEPPDEPPDVIDSLAAIGDPEAPVSATAWLQGQDDNADAGMPRRIRIISAGLAGAAALVLLAIVWWTGIFA